MSAAGSEGMAPPEILVVDPGLEVPLAAILTDRGYRTRVVQGGLQALQAVEACAPDLILLEVELPDLGGLEVCRRLKARPDLQGIPVLLTTSLEGVEGAVEGFEAGAQDFMARPYRIEEVLARIRAHLVLHRQTKDALQGSEARFRSLFQDAPIPFCLVDRQGVVLAFNTRFHQLFGYDASEIPTLEQWWQRAYPDPAYRAWALQTWETAVARAEKESTDIEPIEYRVTCRSGEELIVLISGISMGELSLATFMDVTVRRRAEDALRLSEERLRLALDAISEGIWDWDLRSGKVYRSPHYFELVGRAPSEGGETFEFFATTVHPDDLPHALEVINAHRQGRTPAIEFDYRLWGAPRAKWMRGRGRAVTRDADGVPLRIVGTLADITERKEAEQALIAQQELLNQMGRISHIGGWEFDPATGEGTWTEEVARIHDLDPFSPAGVQVGLDFYHPDSRPRIEQAVREVVEAGKPYDLELEIVSAKGVRKWIRTIGQPVMEDGRVVKVRGSFQDITERKQAEEEIHRLNADLEKRVIERTHDLLVANQELDAFSYAVSHDLRAPLRAMDGYCRALLEDFGLALGSEAWGYLEHITQASQKMSDLIDGLLALSQSARGELAQDPVDLSALATRLLESLERAEPGRRVIWTVEPGLHVTGDARLLESAMQNLLGNAWKYTSRAPSPTIRVYRGEVGGLRGVCVSDNGAGFDLAYAEHLFEPFRRLHRQEEFPGIGIGLATVHRIIQRHGGTIRAEAAPGAGATFCFTLPEPPLGW